jgi:cell division septal protein FtsQ
MRAKRQRARRIIRILFFYIPAFLLFSLCLISIFYFTF